MNATAPENAVADDRTAGSLPALIALRERIGRVRIAPVLSRTARSGQHTTRLFGRGMDYAESRVYQAGDDVRRLDWRLTARSGKLHTKLFQEDRESSTVIVLDTHASMHFGTRVRFKSVQAAHVAAAVAWRATQAGERVGMVGFGAAADQVLRPVGGTRGGLAVCGALAKWDGSASTAAGEALSSVLRRARRLLHMASRIVLISDGFSCDAAAQSPLRELAQRASVRFVLVADVLELELPVAGSYPLESRGHRGVVNLRSPSQQRDFLRALGVGAARLRAKAEALGLRCVQVDVAGDACAASARVFQSVRRQHP
ncbi:MAG: DUF58 domain-containing protein [Rhodanobacter sp.]